MPLPPLMEARRKTLEDTYEMLRTNDLDKLFDCEETIHAGLKLRWMKKHIQRKHIAPDDFQIVVATVRPGQASEPHFHEVGASRFKVLGGDVELPDSEELIYREGVMVRWTDMAARPSRGILCRGMVNEILPYRVHQFDNRGTVPAYLLIVAHPIIYIGDDGEDIHKVNWI